MKSLIFAAFLLFLCGTVAHAQSNTSLGASAGNAGHHNTFVGSQAGKDVTDSATYNVGIGSNSLVYIVDGLKNTAVGVNALHANTSGFLNTGLGFSAGYVNNGFGNTFLGSYAGSGNTAGNYNVFIGQQAGQYSEGDNNVAMGVSAGAKNEGSNNLLLGYSAGFQNINGSGNVFIGYEAGYNELGSNRLIVDNTRTATPLIWGDFLNDVLVFNGNVGISGTLTVNGTNYTGLLANLQETAQQQNAAMDKLKKEVQQRDVEMASLRQQVAQKDAEVASLRQEIEAIKRAMHSGTGDVPEGLQPATLGQNAPNPFTGSTTISYELPGTTQQATLYILDMNGRQVMAVDNLTPGRGQAEIAGSALAPGMYFYSLVADGVEVDTKRMLLTK